MSEPEQDRSELPTSFKLSQARKKGNVARGSDLGFCIALLVLVCFLWAQSDNLGGAVGKAAREMLVTGPTAAADASALLSLTGHAFSAVAEVLIILAVALFVVVLAFELLQTGFVFSGHPLKLDFSKLNPAKGLKRLFSMRMLLETFKNVLKLVVYVVITWLVLRRFTTGDGAMAGDAAALAAAMFDAGFLLLCSFAGAALVFAIVDQLIARKEFTKKMRMSRREVRREHREREGEPRMKQRRKQLHGEFVKASQGLRNVRSADVVIVNPVHVAVALRYDSGRMAAPAVVARGADAFARRIKQIAFVYNVPVVEDRALARALFRRCAVDMAIPDDTYREVADIYLSIRRARQEA